MRILGCDISTYQGIVDFKKMEDAGAKFVILRKQRGYYEDVKFVENLTRAKQTNLKIGAYGVPYVGYDIDKQANKFIEGIVPGDLDFPPFADIELRHSYTTNRAITDVLAYTNKLKTWWGDAVFYTAKFIWEEMYSAARGWIDDWDLWVANYNSSTEPYYIPVGWEYRKNGDAVAKADSYAIWQFSADGNKRGAEFGAQSADIDLNWMHQWFWDKHVEIAPSPPQVPSGAYEVTLDAPKSAEQIIITLNRG